MLFFGDKNNSRQKEAGDKSSNKLNGANAILFVLVGLYLIYLAWKLTSENLPDGIRGDNWYFYLAAVIFVLVGIFSIVRSVLRLKAEAARSKREYEDFLREEREEEELLARAEYSEKECAEDECYAESEYDGDDEE